MDSPEMVAAALDRIFPVDVVTRMPWRVGRSLGRTVYAQRSDSAASKADVLIGTFQTAAIAGHVVALHNAYVAELHGGA